MATGGEAHLQAVTDHLAHGEWLRQSGRTDPTTVGWAITSLFYAALHAVRGYLKACKNVDVTSHDDFKEHVRSYPELKRTSLEYDSLKQQSHSARYYRNLSFSWADFDELRKKAEKVTKTWVGKAAVCVEAGAATAGRIRDERAPNA